MSSAARTALHSGGVSSPADVPDRTVSAAPPTVDPPEPVAAEKPAAAHARAFREVGR